MKCNAHSLMYVSSVLFVDVVIFRAMIIDLDAHQGNGHERDFSDDSMFSPYNACNCPYLLDSTNCFV